VSTIPRFVVGSILGALVALCLGGSPPVAGSTPTVTRTAPAAGLASVCDVLTGLVPDIWQGAGVTPGADDQWDNDANWSLGVAPLHLTDPYACIPPGGLPVIRGGQDARLLALDVNAGAVLQMGAGARLYLYGGALTPSTIQGRVELDGAALAGPARVKVSGTLALNTLGPGNEATLTTRECAYLPAPYPPGELPCLPGVPNAGTTGQMLVDDAGVVEVSGGLVNLGDQYQLVVRGLLVVHDGGTVAADHGTRLELRPRRALTGGAGTLRFEGDGSYLEGKNDFGIARLSTVVNQGQITKSGGTGTSLVTGVYSQPSPGAVTVSSGKLLLPSGSPTPATVSAGSGYGSGQCLVPRQPGCQAQTFGADSQNVDFQVPTSDTSGASVTVQELTTASSPKDIGFPVEAHATGLSATLSDPAILTLRYDERLLGGRGWRSVDVFHQETGTTTWVKLPACLANGNPPSGQLTCVDRRGLAGSSRNVFDDEGPGTAPDVVMVVRTQTTSRWVAH
jgi:hypothetical protein